MLPFVFLMTPPLHKSQISFFLAVGACHVPYHFSNSSWIFYFVERMLYQCIFICPLSVVIAMLGKYLWTSLVVRPFRFRNGLFLTALMRVNSGGFEEALMEVIYERFFVGNCVGIVCNLGRPSIIHPMVRAVKKIRVRHFCGVD